MALGNNSLLPVTSHPPTPSANPNTSRQQIRDLGLDLEDER
jgi:hypothetical protein